jgi:hypothetical protein
MRELFSGVSVVGKRTSTLRAGAPFWAKSIYRTVRQEYRNVTGHLRRLPDFLVIGVQKGGTSTLFAYLKEHPELELPQKEIHFFDLHYDKGLDWYKGHFPLKSGNGKSVTGEATPYYCFHPLVAGRIRQDLPHAKLILLLRNPVDRAYSHYHMIRSQGKVADQTFEDVLRIEEETLAAETDRILADPLHSPHHHQVYSLLSRGKYYEQVSRWFSIFPKEQFLILRSEDFFRNPKDELRKVFDFLGMEAVYPEKNLVVNPGSYTSLDEKTSGRLRNYFAEDQRKLAELLGPSFNWD